jgi:hypothetical protein
MRADAVKRTKLVSSVPLRLTLGALLCAAFTLALSACGSRTGLKGDDLRDAAVGDAPGVDRPIPIDVPGRDQVTAVCPPSARAVVTQTVPLQGAGRSAQGRALRYLWAIEAAPGPTSLSPLDRAATNLPLTAAGDHRVRLTVTNDQGVSDTCVTVVVADPAIDLRCPNDRSVFVSDTANLLATATSRLNRAVTVAWSVRSRPAGSGAAPVPANALSTTLRTDQIGDYDLVLTARDSGGLTETCTTRVHADPDVVVTCPDDVTSRPFTTTTLSGRAVSRLGRPLTYAWTIERSPTTSTARLSPTNQTAARFTFDVAGDWTYRFRATNDRGNSASCTVRALSTSTEAIRVELVWNLDRSCRSCNAEGGGIDIDLHLADDLRANGRWGPNAPADAICYYANCVCEQGRGSLCPSGAQEWSPPGAPNNPQLDIDHIRDLPGPENINVLEAAPGARFAVGVHYFSGSEPTASLVRIYCGGALVFQSEPVTLAGNSGSSDNPVWRVGVINVGGDGRSCTFTRCGSAGNVGACIRAQSNW